MAKNKLFKSLKKKKITLKGAINVVSKVPGVGGIVASTAQTISNAVSGAKKQIAASSSQQQAAVQASAAAQAVAAPGEFVVTEGGARPASSFDLKSPTTLLLVGAAVLVLFLVMRKR